MKTFFYKTKSYDPDNVILGYITISGKFTHALDEFSCKDSIAVKIIIKNGLFHPAEALEHFMECINKAVYK